MGATVESGPSGFANGTSFAAVYIKENSGKVWLAANVPSILAKDILAVLQSGSGVTDISGNEIEDTDVS